MEMSTATVMAGTIYQKPICSHLFLGSRLPLFAKNKMAAITNEVFMEIVRTFPILYDRFPKDFKESVRRIMLKTKLPKPL